MFFNIKKTNTFHNYRLWTLNEMKAITKLYVCMRYY